MRTLKSLVMVLAVVAILSCAKSSGRRNSPAKPPPPPPDPYGTVTAQGAQVNQLDAAFVRHGYDPALNLSWIHFEQRSPTWYDLWLYWPSDTNPGTIDKFSGAEVWLWSDGPAEWFASSINNPNSSALISISKWTSDPSGRTIGTFSGKVFNAAGTGFFDLYSGEFVAVR